MQYITKNNLKKQYKEVVKISNNYNFELDIAIFEKLGYHMITNTNGNIFMVKDKKEVL